MIMEQGTAGVKPGQVDGWRREVPCAWCGAQIRWTRTAAGKAMPCDPAVVHVRGAAHGEDALAKVETVITVGAPPKMDKGIAYRGVRCEASHPGAVAGRIPHWATCPKADQAREASTKEASKASTKEASKASTSAPSTTQPMTPQDRARLIELLREALEDALDAQGCAWTETERGVVITPETRPPKGSAGAVRIARLCACVRVAEGIEAGAWRPREVRHERA